MHDGSRVVTVTEHVATKCHAIPFFCALHDNLAVNCRGRDGVNGERSWRNKYCKSKFNYIQIDDMGFGNSEDESIFSSPTSRKFS